MRALLLLTFLLAVAGAADPPAPPDDARKKAIAELTKLAEGRAELTKLAADWSALLPAAKAGVIDGKVKEVTIPNKIDKKNPVRFPSARAKADYVAALDERLGRLRSQMKEWKSNRPEDFAERLTFLKGGEVGIFPAEKAHVGSVIDKDTVIIDTRTNPEGLERNEPISVLVRGVDTSKWADGIAINTPPGLFVVDTVKRDGTTYFRLTPLILTKEEAAALTGTCLAPR